MKGRPQTLAGKYEGELTSDFIDEASLVLTLKAQEGEGSEGTELEFRGGIGEGKEGEVKRRVRGLEAAVERKRIKQLKRKGGAKDRKRDTPPAHMTQAEDIEIAALLRCRLLKKRGI